MKRKRSVLTHVFLFLRKVGLLCKKQQPYVPKLKIQQSVSPSGDSINHKDFMFAKNALLHVNELGKEKKICHYNFRTHTCRCGITLSDLKNDKNCSLKK
jgi:hypothetical protein